MSYVFCEKDLIISPEKQNGFIDMMKEERKGKGGEVDVYRLDAGHCPNWSVPEKLVEVLGQCADK